MSITSIPVKIEDLHLTLENSANQITFVNSAIMAMCERKGWEMGEDELLGLQTILFDLERTTRGAAECVSENARLLMQSPARK
jgi:hypothetical protein